MVRDGACPVGPGHSSQAEKFLNVFGSSGQRAFHASAASRWLHPRAIRCAARAFTLYRTRNSAATRAQLQPCARNSNAARICSCRRLRGLAANAPPESAW